MTEINQIAYAEVMQVLKYFDRELVMRIPIELLEYFKEHRKKDFIVNIDKEDIFNKNNISEEALALLAYIDMEYWADETEKRELKKRYFENERKHQIELSEKYEDNDILKKEKEIDINEKEVIEETSMIEYKKENIFTKLKKFIINIIGKKK